MHHSDFPPTLHWIAIASLVIAVMCALAIVFDEGRRPQRMWIMNLVWPLTALFGSVVWLAAYWAWGRQSRAEQGTDSGRPGWWVMVFKAASHCGAGCALGDLVMEWLCVAAPAVAVVFGWHRLFAQKTFAVWIGDFAIAFVFGIAFQYFTLVPMRQMSPSEGIRAALKADIASIAAWQLGMYGVMAVLQFVWFRAAFGEIAPVASPEFWFAMQIAMLGGFATSYPINWLLIHVGWKERM